MNLLSKEAVQKVADDFLKRFPGFASGIEVFLTPKLALGSGAHGVEANGAMDRGKTLLLGNGFRSVAGVQRVACHELFHLGLSKISDPQTPGDPATPVASVRPCTAVTSRA